MHITIAPASTHTGRATIRLLLADPSNPSIRGVYRNLAKVPDEFKSHPRFEAVQGDIEDVSSLHFGGSDAVLNIQPAIYEDKDTVAHAKTVSGNIKTAVQAAASVKRLVLVSSEGAQYDHGVGEILTNHAAEIVLQDAAPEVVFVRCAYFMENWAASIETIQEASFFFSTLTPLDFKLPHIATQDIGQACATELLSTGAPLKSNPYIFDLEGPQPYSALDVKRAFEEVVGKELEVRPVEKEGLLDFWSSVFPPEVAKRFTELNLSFLPGGILYENSKPTGETRYGKTELAEVLKQLLGRQ
ncbi:hypothetical protein B0T25DRAFT_571466 [Lasiosphaeria hispida]|uniref:NAD(P)-binding domain-containing protein n=1 Tax=Lasiosphaeria hispida TaxID=260671 RepID=A0AAJ0MAQ4_9PEZI|nr:hypothetical protein B0T25DRAFT_571466 [Lasiosphaeria hispida]